MTHHRPNHGSQLSNIHPDINIQTGSNNDWPLLSLLASQPPYNGQVGTASSHKVSVSPLLSS